MKIVEIRDIDTEDLYLRLGEMKEEYFNLRFQLATGQLDNYKRLKTVKQDIARIRTVIREREIAAYEEAERAAAEESTAGDEAEVDSGE